MCKGNCVKEMCSISVLIPVWDQVKMKYTSKKAFDKKKYAKGCYCPEYDVARRL